jgi:hypothetical protein
VSYNANIELYDLVGGYNIFVKKNEELDKLFKKYNGQVHIEIKKPQDSKTIQQMKALRALIAAFFYTGASSCQDDVNDVDRFTVWIKRQIGYYIPMEIEGEKNIIIKSFGDATKEEMSDCIDKILKLIDMCDANKDPKIIEIIAGMEANKLF